MATNDCDSRFSVQSGVPSGEQSGRLDESGWEGVSSNYEALDLSRFDSPTPGRMGFAMVCDDGVHPDIAPYRLTAGAWL